MTRSLLLEPRFAGTSTETPVEAPGRASPTPTPWSPDYARHPFGTVPRYPRRISGGHWPTSHVQGIAVDRRRGHVYWSFTTLLVKTDLDGSVLGTVEGFTGHLGDLAFDDQDGRVYGSLEYKAAAAFYIAVFDGAGIDRVGMRAQGSTVLTTVYLTDVVDDYTADIDGDGIVDGDVADSADHRYGTSGIDGVSFGPRFGTSGGRRLLTVAYGIYGNTARTDNDNQVLLQYDTRDWRRHERPLDEVAPHRVGPDARPRRYFVHTGNTTFGVQNLAYDDHLRRWFLGVYAGGKRQFPNYTMFSIDAWTRPRHRRLPGGGGERGDVLALAEDGLLDAETGLRGWYQKADVGIQPLGHGYFYLAEDSESGGLQTAEVALHRWTGDCRAPFVPVR